MFLVTVYADSNNWVLSRAKYCAWLLEAATFFIELVRWNIKDEIPDSFQSKFDSFLNHKETEFTLEEDDWTLMQLGWHEWLVSFRFHNGDNFYFAVKIFDLSMVTDIDLHY